MLRQPFIPLLRLATWLALLPSVLLLILLLTHNISPYAFVWSFSLMWIGALALASPWLAFREKLSRFCFDLVEDRHPPVPVPAKILPLRSMAPPLSILKQRWEQQRDMMDAINEEREIMVDSIPDILIMLDRSFTIVRTNASARHVFGQNLSGKKLEDIVRNEALVKAVQETYLEGTDKDVEFFLHEPLESYFRARVHHFPVMSPGRIAVIITLHDITELKRTEQMRADFVANASHEIRTPLASLIGFIETLQGPAKDDKKAQEQFLQIMHDQALRMSQLVNDLLSLSKIEMNAHSIPTDAVMLPPLIEKVAKELTWKADEKQMSINLHMNSALPPARGSQNELEQVAYNLISNAIKYADAETEITVTTEITHTPPAHSPMFLQVPALKLSVQDRGPGIPSEHIPRLTERFYRVSNQSSKKIGGTGLGLAIVKHILHRHRAVLDIQSNEGEGSIFSVYIPIKQA